jgi:hypothetical protein
VKGNIFPEEESIYKRLQLRIKQMRDEFEKKAGEHLMDKSSEIVLKREIHALENLGKELAGSEMEDNKDLIKEWFAGREMDRREACENTGRHLSNCFNFLQQIYGEEQEMVLFLTRLDAGHYSLNYIQNEGSEEYYKYNKMLLLRDVRKEIVEQILEV